MIMIIFVFMQIHLNTIIINNILIARLKCCLFNVYFFLTKGKQAMIKTFNLKLEKFCVVANWLAGYF